MKSFRLYLREPITAPAREVADYSPDEQSRLRGAFAPIASKHRRHARISYIAGGGFVCCVLLMMILPKALSPDSLIPLPIFWLVGMWAVLSEPRLVCPGCSNEIDGRLGPYCPECGNRHLESSGWLQPPYCTTCKKSMQRGKYRRYTIRACTHCGLMLDDRGL